MPARCAALSSVQQPDQAIEPMHCRTTALCTAAILRGALRSAALQHYCVVYCCSAALVRYGTVINLVESLRHFILIMARVWKITFYYEIIFKIIIITFLCSLESSYVDSNFYIILPYENS